MLLGLYKEDILPLVFTNLYEAYLTIWNKSINETKIVEETMYSACFFNDLLEFATMQVI